MSQYKCIKCGIDCGDDAYLCEEDNECFCKTCWDTVSDKYDVTPDESVEESFTCKFCNKTINDEYSSPEEKDLYKSFHKKCFDEAPSQHNKKDPNEKMIIYANFTAQARYDIPSDIMLLSNEDNESNNGERTPGAWWVKYNSLYYYDENLKICEIEATYPAEVDDKYPLDYTVDYDYPEDY